MTFREDDRTPLRPSTFASALVEGCLTQVISTLQKAGYVITEDTERELRCHLEDFQALQKRRSDTAIRAANEAEIDADRERVRREALERRMSDLELDLAAANLRAQSSQAEADDANARARALKAELDQLRREIVQ